MRWVRRTESAATVVVEGVTIFVQLEGIIDFQKETARLEKEIRKIAGELVGVEKKLANPGFLGKAPADVVQKVKDKQQALSEKRDKLQANLEKIREMG